MLSRDELSAHSAALRAAGILGPVNAEPAALQVHPELLEGEWTQPMPMPSSADFTDSSDPRLAAAARRRERELANLPQVEASELELPPETPPLEELPDDVRRHNAGTMATGMPEDYVYGE